MRYTINTVIILSIFIVKAFAGFNIITNNDLQFDQSYSYSDFYHEFYEGAEFVCAVEDADWGVPYKTVVEITDKTPTSISIQDAVGQIALSVNKTNFKKFRKSFITGKCLQFENNFPVKTNA